MHAIEASGIVMEFGRGALATRVLHDVALTVELGALTMLVGPSGCGKTTLISILSGTLTPTAGEILVMGERLSAMGDSEKVRFRRRRIGFIFQQYNLLPALTAAENAAVGLVAAGMKLPHAAARAAEILAGLGMADHIHKLPNTLSGGQQQRVAIARALVHEPDLIVCDEPTAALDAAAGLQVMGLLKNAAAGSARAVLTVTHDNRVFGFADRIISMEDGRIVGDRAPHPNEETSDDFAAAA